MNTQNDRFEADRAAAIKTRIGDMRRRDPKLSFVAAWNKLQSESPSLFAEASSVTARGSNDNIDLADLARRIDKPVRIAAAPAPLEGETLRVYGPNVELIQSRVFPE